MATLLERLQNIGINTFGSTPAIIEPKQKQRFEIPITRQTIEQQVAKQKEFEATKNKDAIQKIKPFVTGLYQYPARTLTSFGLDVTGKKQLAQPKSTLAERVQRYLLGVDDIGAVRSASQRVISGAETVKQTATTLGVKKELPSFLPFALSSIGLGGGTFIDAYLGGGKGKIAKELVEEAISKIGKEQTEKILKEGGEKLLKEQIQSFDPLLSEARKYKSAEEFVNKAIANYKESATGNSIPGAMKNSDLLFEALDNNPKVAKTIANKSVNQLKSDGIKYLYREGSENGISWSTKPELTEKFKAYSYGNAGLKKIPLNKETLNRVVYYDNAGIGKFNNMHENEVILKPKSQLTDIWNKANTPTKVGTKERGFITSVKETFPELKVAGRYIPRDTDSLAIKAKNLIKDNIDLAESIALKGTNDKAMATAAELIKHYENLKVYDKAADIANVVAKKLTEQGRYIQAAAILGQQTPEGQLRFAARLIQQYNEEVAKKSGFLGLRKQIPELTAEQAKVLTTEYKVIQAMPDGVEKAMAFKEYSDKIASLIPSPFYKKVINLWKAGLLTGIKTSGLNTSSNLFHGVSEIVKDIPAAAVDSVASLFTSKRTLALTARGTKSGVKEGLEKGWRYLKTGFDERDVASKLDYRKVNFGNSKVAKALQTYEQTVFKIMGAEDQPFYYGAKSRSLYSQAIAQAKKLKGRTQKEFIDNFVKNPSDEALKYATNDALTAVFQNRTLLGDIARGIQKIPGGEVLVPFGKTPSAVAMQLANYSPVGIVKTIVQNIGKGKFDQRLFSQGIGRGLTGTAAMFIGLMAYKKDLISLDYPKNQKEQKQWELEGRKENSILIDGKWRGVAVLGPLGFVLLTGGYYQRGMDNSGSHSQALTQATIGGFTSLSEQTFLQGLSQFTDAIKDPENYSSALLSRLLGSGIPTLIADVAKSTDKLERRAGIKEGFLTPLKSRIPGLRQTLEPKVDVLGNQLELSGNAIETMIDPSRPSRIKSSEVIEELRRLNDAGFISTPTTFANEKTYRDVLQPSELTSLQERAGFILESKLENLFASKQYQALTDEEKQGIIQNFTSEARIVARAEMIENLLLDLSDKEKVDKIVELKESGFLSKSVFERWVDLFDPQINASPTKKSTAIDNLQNSTNEKSLLENLVLYSKAIGTDPFTAFNRIFTGQRIRRLDNGAIIVERMPFVESQAVRAERGATNEVILDHTIPLQLGGSNSEKNLKLVPKADWQRYTPIENYLGELLRNGKITKKEAQDLIIRFKNGEITESDIIK
jgi:hypothetical protein